MRKKRHDKSYDLNYWWNRHGEEAKAMAVNLPQVAHKQQHQAAANFASALGFVLLFLRIVSGVSAASPSSVLDLRISPVEYRNNFCYNRTFAPSPTGCSWDYLPRLSRLSTVSILKNTTRGSNNGRQSKGHRRRLMILMQNHRVGSTWLVHLLNTLGKHITCKGEKFNSNPCKKEEGIEKSVFSPPRSNC